MKTRLILLLLIATLAACSGHDDDHDHDHDGHDHGAATPADEEFERGPTGGRLLRSGGFALEVALVEADGPPRFRLYASRDGSPVPPAGITARIETRRLGDRLDVYTFTADGDALAGSGEVPEPHSFDVVVTAAEGGRQHRWEYAAYEGRTTLDPQTAASSGVRTAVAGPATIRSTVSLLGTVAVDGNRVARVRARFPGIVREVRATAGATVRRGDVLAIVEGNESMRPYPVTAPIKGVVTARDTNVGDVTGEAALFEISDLSAVWVDLHAFGRDIPLLRAGQPVTLTSTIDGTTTSAAVDSVLPLAAAGSQSAIARVKLANPQGLWRPGLAVSAAIGVAESTVPLAVETRALQPFREFTVVYAQYGDTYEVRMLELGQRDPDFVEVLGGIEPGTRYVTEQAFLIRADVEKSGAGHDH